jgi:hypothetical protein
MGQLSQLGQLSERGSLEVARLTARYAEFAGWLMQDSGDSEKGLQLTERSIDYAEAAGDGALSTFSTMRKANILTTLGSAQLAATTARKALTAAHDQFCQRRSKTDPLATAEN